MIDGKTIFVNEDKLIAVTEDESGIFMRVEGFKEGIQITKLSFLQLLNRHKEKIGE